MYETIGKKDAFYSLSYFIPMKQTFRHLTYKLAGLIRERLAVVGNIYSSGLTVGMRLLASTNETIIICFTQTDTYKSNIFALNFPGIRLLVTVVAGHELRL